MFISSFLEVAFFLYLFCLCFPSFPAFLPDNADVFLVAYFLYSTTTDVFTEYIQFKTDILILI